MTAGGGPWRIPVHDNNDFRPKDLLVVVAHGEVILVPPATACTLPRKSDELLTEAIRQARAAADGRAP